jgi:hypothetical protein
VSKLRRANGDDYPEAALKHLDDASALLIRGRHDGTAYLAGYVVECSLKALLQYETGVGVFGHDLARLAAQVSALCAVAGARTARYIAPPVRTVPVASIAAWEPKMRYHAPGMSAAGARAWLQDAESIFLATVGRMALDGVL